MYDHMLREVAKSRIEEMRSEVTRARLAGQARGSGGRELRPGLLGGPRIFGVAGEGVAGGASEEVCCA